MKKLLHSFRHLTLAAVLCAPLAAGAADAVEIPFESPLDTPEDFARWTTYDVDGNVEGEKATWFLGKSDYGGDAAASYTDAVSWKPTDNWLVSPPVKLEADKDYALKLKYYTSYYNNEKFSILLSTSPEPSAEHTILYDTEELKNYYGGNLSVLLPDIAATGQYYISFRHHSTGIEGMCVFIKNLSLDEMKEGAVEGTVTTYDRVADLNRPVEGLKVILKGPGEFTAMTDAEGKYRFDAIPASDYEVTWSKFGIANESYPRTITVTPAATLTHDIKVYPMDTQSVTGTITDNAGSPLPGAVVTLSGYATYNAKTDAEGKFRIEGIYLYNGYYDNTYDYHISKNGFDILDGNKEIRRDYMGGDSDIGKFALTYNPVAPYSITVTEKNASVDLSWMRPVDNRLYKYDTGTADAPLGYEGAIDNILGSVYRTPMNIDAVTWYRMKGTDATDPPATVNILIIDLDENGEPNGEILYRKDNILSPLNDWSEVHFDSPVSAPRGFLLAINTAGYVSIAKDDGTVAAPARTQLFSNSFSGGYRYFEEMNWPGALMLRASGEIIENGEFTPQVTYDLFRFEQADADSPEKWTSLGTGLADLQKIDDTFASLPRGSYRYAVKAVYSVDNLTSQPTVSDVIHKDQFTAVTVNVTADSDPADAEGTLVRLDDHAGHAYSATVASGKVAFDKVWKAVYILSISKKGFSAADASVDFNDKASYEHNASIKQDIVPVTNIDVTTEDGDAYRLRWDIFADINESFEGDGYADFEINPAGELGWSYIDNDRFPTYGFSGHTFPGMNSPMAAVIVNPAAATPVIERKYARTGQRALGFFAAYPTETSGGMELNQSDDYLISHRLDYHKDFTFSFYAKTHESQEGRLETIRAGYSLSGTEIDDFTWLTEDYVDVPEDEYTLFSYTIPAEARYVTLNNRSDDVFLLLVDDITLTTGITHSGKAPSCGSFSGYKVWLDGKHLTDTSANEWLLTDLADGEHTAEVSKVYKGGESEKLSVTFNAVSGIIDNVVARITIRYAAPALTITGDYTEASVWSVAGMKVAGGITRHAPVDLSHLAPGLYIVRASAADGSTVTAKITVR